jgi:excisionase family DNA binding protein
MPQRPAHHRVKQHLVYSVGEAVEVLGVHRQTVVRWIRIDSLPADTERRPWLIRRTRCAASAAAPSTA